jgi:hypothetical protein
VIATDAQADREFARNVGRDNPGEAWVLSDRDAWYRNPFYEGPAQPHPEAGPDYYEEPEFVASVDTFVGPPAPLDPAGYWDDIPF